MPNNCVTVPFSFDNGVTSSYKTDTPTAKSDMLQKEKSELEKGINWIYCVEYYWLNKDKVGREVLF